MENEIYNIDLTPILNGIVLTATVNILSRVIAKRIVVSRDFKYREFTVRPVPSELLSSDVKRFSNFCIKKEFAIKIKDFISTIKEQVPEVNLSALYNNSQKFEINPPCDNYRLLKRKHIVAFYRPGYTTKNGKNNITFLMDDYSSSINHELLHMASSRETEDYFYTGFSQYSKNGNIGIGSGLNEGYTALLANQLFNNDRSYIKGQELATMIEFLVGRQKMQKYYFESNLYALVEDLKAYFSYEEIIDLLEKIDFVVKYSEDLTMIGRVNEVYFKLLGKLVEKNTEVLEEELCSKDAETLARARFKEFSFLMTLMNFKHLEKIVGKPKNLDFRKGSKQ